jgi:hypothetical protein
MQSFQFKCRAVEIKQESRDCPSELRENVARILETTEGIFFAGVIVKSNYFRQFILPGAWPYNNFRKTYTELSAYAEMMSTVRTWFGISFLQETRAPETSFRVTKYA